MFKTVIKTVLLSVIGSGVAMAAKNNLPKQTLYYGGDILTMEGDTPHYVEAVMVKEGRIIYTGKKANAVNNYAGETVKVDLKGKTMMPAFFDPHEHLLLTNLIDAVHFAANRKSIGGKVYGADQAMSPYERLKAITINAAWQHGEEKEKGALTKGKQADMVILSANPLKVDKSKIREIKVLETINDGKTIYTATAKPGSDRDAHGCIGSAGYKWCAKTNQCERPWELAQKENFKKSAEAFNSFCQNR